jgi:hypothetical protein
MCIFAGDFCQTACADRTQTACADRPATPVRFGKGIKLRDGEDIAVLTIGAIGNPMSEAIESVSPKDGLSAKRSVLCQR